MIDSENFTASGTGADVQWLEDIASNCSLRMEHVERFNISQFMLMRLYNLCEHTWDPSKTWEVYYWGELIPPLIIYSLTLLLGIVGNLLIIIAITGYRTMKSPTNIFLASLACADLLLCVVCLPIKLAELFSFSWTFGLFLCKFVNYMQYVSAVASVLNLTVMSLERCYAIVYPLKAKSICTVSKAQKVVVGVWISAFLLATPILFIQRHKEVGLVQKVFWCVRDDESPLLWRIHEIYSLLVLLLIPGTFMVAAYGIIAREICRCMKERTFLTNRTGGSGSFRYKPNEKFPPEKSNSSVDQVPLVTRCNFSRGRQRHANIVEGNVENEDGRISDVVQSTESAALKQPLRNKRSEDSIGNQKDFEGNSNPWIPINSEFKVQKQSLQKFRRVIRMLAAIVIVFVLCWTPFLVMNILRSFGIINNQLHGFVKYANTTFTLMAYLNSALNPIIYGFMSNSFRENFRKTVGCHKERNGNHNHTLNYANRNASVQAGQIMVGGRNSEIASGIDNKPVKKKCIL